ncbi:LLM class flavin-dependent oxidoreductase [Siccirubricoccus phaeus]|uniref:LLM class flavin-dependent oxidoreductase n=1 Tax=Siccirubricoccus phaeus TaxID=2595053 RepID=UPI0011F1BB9E|nr:LLM class flavin-dependent oxidoreductase [Siccirubricoccus phaeus]
MRKMHLGSLSHGVGGHVAGWRMPGAETEKERFEKVAQAVKTAERGKFDFVFFADAVNTGADAAPGFIVRFEPLTLLGALSVATSRIGLVATVSTTYSEPYNVARAFASLDHLSGGRIGWNVVTGSSPDAAANFSREKHPPHAERYAMAEEYIQVVKGLWDSWEDDAAVADKATGVFMDASKLHVLNHAGTYYTVKGPLNASRPPQGYPVIFQAGASDRGLELAGATAEVVFASQWFKEDAIAFCNRLRDQAEAAGRPRDAIRILLGVSTIIGETREEAQDIIARLGAMVDPVAAMRVLSDRLGADMSQFDIDGPVPDLPPSTMMQGHARVLQAVARRFNLTIRQLRDYAAVSSGHRVLAGTARDVADDLQDWFESGACDGFAIMTPFSPQPFERFVDQVVPILQQRGLYRSDYAGTTLREHLLLPRPAHPATRKAVSSAA